MPQKNRSNFQHKYRVKVRLIVLRCSALSSLKGVQHIVAISKCDPCKIYKYPAELLSLLGCAAVSIGIVVEVLEKFLHPRLWFKKILKPGC